MPYPKEKQKKNKILNEIGIANGIYYPATNIIKYNSKNHKFSLSNNKNIAKKNNITSKNNISNVRHKNYFLD